MHAGRKKSGFMVRCHDSVKEENWPKRLLRVHVRRPEATWLVFSTVEILPLMVIMIRMAKMLTTVFLLMMMMTMVMPCRCVADYDGDDDANDDGDGGGDTMMIIMTVVLLKLILARLKG